MKQLLVLRHAKSSWKQAHLSDFERPLNQRGLKNAARMGELIKSENLVPELIVSSPAKRALTTAQIVARNCGYEGEIRLENEFYLALPRVYLDLLRMLEEEYNPVMVVGHNPGAASLVGQLTGEQVVFPTGALALIELPVNGWHQLNSRVRGKLFRLWRPRELDQSDQSSPRIMLQEDDG